MLYTPAKIVTSVLTPVTGNEGCHSKTSMTDRNTDTALVMASLTTTKKRDD